MYDQFLQLAISGIALFTLVGGFFIGVRYQCGAQYEPLPVALLVVGMVGMIAGVIGFMCAAPPIFATGIVIGACLAGVGIGLQVTQRTE